MYRHCTIQFVIIFLQVYRMSTRNVWIAMFWLNNSKNKIKFSIINEDSQMLFNNYLWENVIEKYTF